MALAYFEFYHGNLKNGFDFVYGKQLNASEAFVVAVNKELKAPRFDISDAEINFMPRNEDTLRKNPLLRRYAHLGQDVSLQWKNIERHMHELTAQWVPEMQKLQIGETDEWGLRFFDDEIEAWQQYMGANAEPDNLAEFENWLQSLGHGHVI
ncbi:phosphoesterase [Weissella ceti]|uniref:Phosphoesterase n=1 Tax=Weissella ceti TaxID=759620 RepID=A0ABT3E2T8_9LACO|nr:phosphoesterase [Weissella ceti]MCW0952547.1 phosphoesterase [Weissella ceti]QVK11787.1 phosphoesterase [Weissella ceti]